MAEKKLRAVVVGGSIAGLSCAHALLRGCSPWLEVVVYERALSVTAAGAGLGLDPAACDALRDWGLGDALAASSLPLSMEEVRTNSFQSSPLR
jgi:2-polyprenyl-6-methoxyphenol hydroxylase-like FAD-dependent oxidoreductase